MSSTLTYQLRQQQEDNKHDGNQVTNLPSPPNSSCGDETTITTSTISNTSSVSTSSSTTTTTTIDNNNNNIVPTINTPIPTPQQLQQRRDSLQSHFSTLTLQAISNSLPENYTIDHSTIKASLQQALNNTNKKLTPNNNNNNNNTNNTNNISNNNNNNNNSNNNNTIKASSPIPIENTPVRRNGATLTNNGSYRSESLMPSQNLSPASIAAGTGGLTIRHRRPSTIDYRNKKGNSYLSEPPNNNNNSLLKSSTSLPSNASSHHGQQYRCDDCGKIYKHPSCLTKHKWEHSEEWELTSKFLLTKHQQVQMLEAAAILVSMDNNGSNSSLPDTTTIPIGSPLLDHHHHHQQQQQSYNNNYTVNNTNTNNINHLNDNNNNDDDDDMNMNTDSDVNDDESIHIDDDDDESIHIDDDDDDDDISIEMDQDENDHMKNTQHTTFPSMIGSTPAMLPTSFATNTV